MNVNSVIANLGNGNVTTDDIITGDIHQETHVTNEHREEFLHILEELKSEIDKLQNPSAREAVEIIQDETKKEIWDSRIIKFALDTVQKIGVTLASKAIITLGSKALSLLPYIV